VLAIETNRSDGVNATFSLLPTPSKDTVDGKPEFESLKTISHYGCLLESNMIVSPLRP
jgi:hypothetical protein